MSKAKVLLSGNIPLPDSTTTFDLLPRPNLVITVPKNISEAAKAELISAGFAAQTNGRYQYYRGPPTDAAVKTAIKLGATTDAFAPSNNVSVNGLLAFSIINKVFYHAFAVIHQATRMVNVDLVGETEIPVLSWDEPNFKITEKNLGQSVPEKGYFFPYFDGLVLPDRAKTLSVISRHFSLCFGKNARRVETLTTIASGWLTLADTNAGRSLSHMAFCIENSISLGIVIRPVFLNDEYCGCVFYTTDVGVIQGNTFVKPGDQAELRAGIDKMISHEKALQAIVTIIDELEWNSDQRYPTSLDSIVYPRDIHNILALKKVTPASQPKLMELVRKTRFRQTFWDVTNSNNVMRAIVLITKKETPDRDVPFNLRIDALWTQDPIYSVLAAFGVKAPSLRGFGTQKSIRVSPDMYKFSKPGTLTGVPVFAKSYVEAKEDWSGVLSELQVWFDHKNADKNGVLRIKNLKTSIPFDTEQGRAIMNALSAIAKKRPREEGEGIEKERTQEEIDAQAKAKRRRLKGYEVLGLDVPRTDEMEEDEVDPFA